MIYLACPYTHPDFEVREYRYRAVNQALAYLIKQDLVVFSPISMTHGVDILLGRIDPEYWYKFDDEFMQHCAECYVLTLPGWSTSNGVSREIKHFRNNNKPVRFMNSVNFELWVKP
jgi:hypothetical protein